LDNARQKALLKELKSLVGGMKISQDEKDLIAAKVKEAWDDIDSGVIKPRIPDSEFIENIREAKEEVYPIDSNMPKISGVSDEWIIHSMLDTDLYKLTMMQVVFHQFQNVNVEFAFKCRNYPGVQLRDHIPEIKRQIKHLCTLHFKENELDYLAGLTVRGGVRIFKADFIEFLRYFKLDYRNIDVIWNEITKVVDIPIIGSWLSTILFEVPVLAIVSEVFSTSFGDMDVRWRVGKERLIKKIDVVLNYNLKVLSEYGPEKFKEMCLKYVDFGSRRRFMRSWHEYTVRTMKNKLPDNFVGTSNVWLAMKYDLTPIGTFAHEYVQGCQQLTRLIDSQKFALQKWADEYRGALGIALSDTVGFDAFLRDFDMYFAKLFDGCRQDSGDPYVWAEKLIAHYNKLGIDPKTKVAVFSDGLDMEKAIELHGMFVDRIKVSFGIGTNLTNDVGIKAMQIVIKMIKCMGQPVAKISDSIGKLMCMDIKFLRYLAEVFQIDIDVEQFT